MQEAVLIIILPLMQEVVLQKLYIPKKQLKYSAEKRKLVGLCTWFSQIIILTNHTETSTSSEVSTQPWPVVIILSNVVVNLIIALLAAVAIVIVCTYQEIMKHSTP